MKVRYNKCAGDIDLKLGSADIRTEMAEDKMVLHKASQCAFRDARWDASSASRLTAAAQREPETVSKVPSMRLNI